MASDGRYARYVKCCNRLENCRGYAVLRESDIRAQAETRKKERELRLRWEFAKRSFQLCDPEEVYETVFAAKSAEYRKELAGLSSEEVQKRAEAYDKELAERIRAGLPKGGDGAEKARLESEIAAGAAELDKKAEAAVAALRKKTEKRAAALVAAADRANRAVRRGACAGKLPEGTVLRVSDLCMYFGGVKAVDGLSFDVKKGEIFGLIGPNGAGKTTVFNSITQFYKPTAGEMYFENKAGETVSLTGERVHDIILHGIVRTFQNVEVIREVTVLDNLRIAGHRRFTVPIAAQALHLPSLKREERVIEAEALRVLDFMGLTAYKDWYAYGLPYGVLKKIEIARTLMCSPQLIILDEPAAGLNENETRELSQLIRRIRDEYGCTILLVEHDMGLVMDICETVCAISFGKLLAIGAPADIQGDPEVRRAYLGDDSADKEES